MHRIDGPGATISNTFVEADPAHGIAKTLVTAPWANAVQEELAAPIEDSGQTLNKASNAQLLQAIALLSGSRSSGRNFLDNGDFVIWQRDTAGSSGTSVAVNPAALEKYTADRWFVQSDASAGAGQSTCIRLNHTIGQTEVPLEPEYYFRFVHGTPATVQKPRLGQKIEDVRQTSGRQLTISFYARAAAALSIDLVTGQNFGVGGSAPATTSTHTFAVTTSFQRFRQTIALPSVVGATLGPASYLRVELQGPMGASWTLDVSDFQVELGPEASGYERRALALELRRCFRYYEKSWPWDTPVGTAGDEGSIAAAADNSGALYALKKRFNVQKRATPSVVFYGLSGTINKIALAGSGPTFGATPNPESTISSVLQVTSQDAGYIFAPGLAVAGTGYRLAAGHFVADAEL